MKQKLKIRNIISITVSNFIQIQKFIFVRISLNRLSKFKRPPVVSITIYRKESDKNVYFGNFLFHWLEIKQIEKILIEIPNFELIIKKTIQTRQEISLWCQLYMLLS